MDFLKGASAHGAREKWQAPEAASFFEFFVRQDCATVWRNRVDNELYHKWAGGAHSVAPHAVAPGSRVSLDPGSNVLVQKSKFF